MFQITARITSFFLAFILVYLTSTYSQTVVVLPTPQYKVIIIGAGIAGLEAARYLQEHGENNFIILEARNRIGGRAWTVHPSGWGHVSLDLGASWIQGAEDGNPIMRLVKLWQIETHTTNEKLAVVYDAHGKELSHEQEKFYTELYKQFKKYMIAEQRFIGWRSTWSISDAVLAFSEVNHLSRAEQAGLLYMVSGDIEQEYAADITNLSLRWYNHDHEFKGENLILHNGYQEIINGVAQGFRDHILLNHVVAEVNYSDPNSIAVTTTNGQTFSGQYVICTLPLGVLQRGSVRFIPELPPKKLAAIHEHLGMGIYNKIYMLFPHVFWDTSDKNEKTGEKQPVERIERVPYAYWSGNHWIDKGKWIEFMNMHLFTHVPILTAFVSGDFARNLEFQSNAQIISSVMYELRKIYGSDVPNPKSTIITRWGHDPYSGGSYSSIRPGALSNSRDYRIMAKPLGHLLFAGEATTALYPASIPGAYITGERAAKYIVEGPWSVVREYPSAIDTSVDNLFLATPVFSNTQGEVGIQFLPDYRNGHQENQGNLPVSVYVGVTDRLTLSATWETYTRLMPKSATPSPSTQGIGNLELSAQYHFDKPFKIPDAQAAIGFLADLPTADINKELTDGLAVYQPYVIFQQGLPALHNLQLFTENALGFVSRVKRHSQVGPAEIAPIEPDDLMLNATEGDDELNKDEPAAHRLVWNIGGYLPTQHFRYIAMLNWINNQWNNHGKENELFFTPGIIWKWSQHFEVGMAVPLGLNHKTDHYRVLGLAGIEIY